MSNNEAPLSVTMKPGTGYDAPMLTIRADSPQELQERLTMIENSGILDAVGRVATAFAGKYELGKQLGASTMGDPVQYQQPPAQPAPAAAPPQPDAWAAPQQQQAAPQYQAPQPQAYAPPAPAPQAAMPGAPMVLGVPARMVNSQPGAARSWRAWADPRPKQVTDMCSEKTDDPNHPGLAMGTHKFWAFIR